MINQEKSTVTDHSNLLNLTSAIVSAHVSNNPVSNDQLPVLIKGTFAALAGCSAAAPTEGGDADSPARAYTGSVKSSIKAAGLISMIDGKTYKTLKRHIRGHGYTAESYRAAYGLPVDYPMIAPDYAEKRREIAIKFGLGRKPRAA